MKSSETLLLGLALGAGLTYFLDRDRGTRRRALVRDRVVRVGHELEEAAVANARHARNRASGLMHEARAGLMENAVDDRVLEERVRSEIGRQLSAPAHVDVAAENGRVTLAGNVPAHDLQSVVRAAKSVRGVDRLDNQLVPDAQLDATQDQEAARS